MADYKVIVNSDPTYLVRVQPSIKLKSITTLTMDMPPSFFDLIDVVNANKYDKYVVTYDSTLNKIVLVNPDEVLSSSTIEPDENRVDYTLPQDFEDKLGVDLDNQIDVDAGQF